MFQKLTLIGRLTRDPEMRYTPGGKAVCNFSIATNNWKKEPTYWKITTWEKKAETCNEHLAKGRMVHIEGEITSDGGNPRVYQRRDGSWAGQFEVTARTVTFLGGRQEAQQAVDEVFGDDGVPPF